MAISGLQIINIGLQNESLGSDSLYTAFNKTKTNFATLFANASPFNTFTGNTGITVAANTTSGIVDITNTGVTYLNAGTGVILSGNTGNITISSIGGGGGGGGTVTSVGVSPVSASRLTVSGSPIVSSGTITLDLAASGVVAGSYTYPSMTVDAYGRVTNISNGASVGTVTSIGVTPGFGIQVTGSPITTSGNITILNTGVTRLNAGTNISLSGSNGNVTISATGPGTGTVTSVGISSSTLNISGSPVTVAGTITVEIPTSGTTTVGNLVVNGNLTVDGNIVYINTEILSVEDPIIQVGTGPNGAAPTSNSGKDLGTALNYYDSVAKVAWMGWDVSNAEISFGSNVSISSEVVTINNLANVRTGNLIVSGNANISGTFNATGNANVGNLGTTTAIVTTGNITTINSGLLQNGTSNITITSGGSVSTFIGGNTTAQFVVTSTGANIPGTANVVGNANVGNLGTATAIITTGNITTINSGLLQNGNSNVTITANGNVTINAIGGQRLVLTSTGANISGTANVTGNANVGNLGTATAIITTGNITTINSGLLQNGTSNVTIASSGNVTIAVGGTERVRADTAGNIYLGATTGSESLRVQPTASSVNFVLTQGGAVGTGPTITATGSDANVNLRLATKGSGQVQELVGSTYYALASQYDIGTNPNQIPLNQYLGTMAYQDSAGISVGTAALGIGTGSEGFRVNTVANSVNYITAIGSITSASPNVSAQGSDTNIGMLIAAKGSGNIAFTVGNVIVTGAGGLGYGTGSGGTQTQTVGRTNGVTIDKTNGSITLVSAAGTTSWQSFTVTNNTVAATDTVIVNQRSGTDLYMIHVTAVAAGSFRITFATTGGTTTEQPVFNFAVIKAVTA